MKYISTLNSIRNINYTFLQIHFLKHFLSQNLKSSKPYKSIKIYLLKHINKCNALIISWEYSTLTSFKVLSFSFTFSLYFWTSPPYRTCCICCFIAHSYNLDICSDFHNQVLLESIRSISSGNKFSCNCIPLSVVGLLFLPWRLLGSFSSIDAWLETFPLKILLYCGMSCTGNWVHMILLPWSSRSRVWGIVFFCNCRYIFWNNRLFVWNLENIQVRVFWVRKWRASFWFQCFNFGILWNLNVHYHYLNDFRLRNCFILSLKDSMQLNPLPPCQIWT